MPSFYRDSLSALTDLSGMSDISAMLRRSPVALGDGSGRQNATDSLSRSSGADGGTPHGINNSAAGHKSPMGALNDAFASLTTFPTASAVAAAEETAAPTVTRTTGRGIIFESAEINNAEGGRPLKRNESMTLPFPNSRNSNNSTANSNTHRNSSIDALLNDVDSPFSYKGGGGNHLPPKHLSIASFGSDADRGGERPTMLIPTALGGGEDVTAASRAALAATPPPPSSAAAADLASVSGLSSLSYTANSHGSSDLSPTALINSNRKNKKTNKSASPSSPSTTYVTTVGAGGPASVGVFNDSMLGLGESNSTTPLHGESLSGAKQRKTKRNDGGGGGQPLGSFRAFGGAAAADDDAVSSGVSPQSMELDSLDMLDLDMEMDRLDGMGIFELEELMATINKRTEDGEEEVGTDDTTESKATRSPQQHNKKKKNSLLLTPQQAQHLQQRRATIQKRLSFLQMAGDTSLTVTPQQSPLSATKGRGGGGLLPPKRAAADGPQTPSKSPAGELTIAIPSVGPTGADSKDAKASAANQETSAAAPMIIISPEKKKSLDAIAGPTTAPIASTATASSSAGASVHLQAPSAPQPTPSKAPPLPLAVQQAIQQQAAHNGAQQQLVSQQQNGKVITRTYVVSVKKPIYYSRKAPPGNIGMTPPVVTAPQAKQPPAAEEEEASKEKDKDTTNKEPEQQMAPPTIVLERKASEVAGGSNKQKQGQKPSAKEILDSTFDAEAFAAFDPDASGGVFGSVLGMQLGIGPDWVDDLAEFVSVLNDQSAPPSSGASSPAANNNSKLAQLKAKQTPTASAVSTAVVPAASAPSPPLAATNTAAPLKPTALAATPTPASALLNVPPSGFSSHRHQSPSIQLPRDIDADELLEDFDLSVSSCQSPSPKVVSPLPAPLSHQRASPLKAQQQQQGSPSPPVARSAIGAVGPPIAPSVQSAAAEQPPAAAQQSRPVGDVAVRQTAPQEPRASLAIAPPPATTPKQQASQATQPSPPLPSKNAPPLSRSPPANAAKETHSVRCPTPPTVVSKAAANGNGSVHTTPRRYQSPTPTPVLAPTAAVVPSAASPSRGLFGDGGTSSGTRVTAELSAAATGAEPHPPTVSLAAQHHSPRPARTSPTAVASSALNPPAARPPLVAKAPAGEEDEKVCGKQIVHLSQTMAPPIPAQTAVVDSSEGRKASAATIRSPTPPSAPPPSGTTPSRPRDSILSPTAKHSAAVPVEAVHKQPKGQQAAPPQEPATSPSVKSGGPSKHISDDTAAALQKVFAERYPNMPLPLSLVKWFVAVNRKRFEEEEQSAVDGQQQNTRHQHEHGSPFVSIADVATTQSSAVVKDGATTAMSGSNGSKHQHAVTSPPTASPHPLADPFLETYKVFSAATRSAEDNMRRLSVMMKRRADSIVSNGDEEREEKGDDEEDPDDGGGRRALQTSPQTATERRRSSAAASRRLSSEISSPHRSPSSAGQLGFDRQGDAILGTLPKPSRNPSLRDIFNGTRAKAAVGDGEIASPPQDIETPTTTEETPSSPDNNNTGNSPPKSEADPSKITVRRKRRAPSVVFLTASTAENIGTSAPHYSPPLPPPSHPACVQNDSHKDAIVAAPQSILSPKLQAAAAEEPTTALTQMGNAAVFLMSRSDTDSHAPHHGSSSHSHGDTVLQHSSSCVTSIDPATATGSRRESDNGPRTATATIVSRASDARAEPATNSDAVTADAPDNLDEAASHAPDIMTLGSLERGQCQPPNCTATPPMTPPAIYMGGAVGDAFATPAAGYIDTASLTPNHQHRFPAEGGSGGVVGGRFPALETAAAAGAASASRCDVGKAVNRRESVASGRGNTHLITFQGQQMTVAERERRMTESKARADYFKRMALDYLATTGGDPKGLDTMF